MQCSARHFTARFGLGLGRMVRLALARTACAWLTLIWLALVLQTSWLALTLLTLLGLLTLARLLTRMRLARLRLTQLSDSDTTGLADLCPTCIVSVARLTLTARLILLTLADQLKLMWRTWTLVQLIPTRRQLTLVQLTP